MKHKGRPTTQKEIVNWLAEQETYSLHKPVRRRFPRRKIFSRGIDYLWQADLVDMTHLAKHNDGHRYLLTVIDVFSKYAFATTTKKKDTKGVTEAFGKILEMSGRKPLKLQTDKGKEFVNDTFQRKLRDESIQFYVSQNEDIKASVVERFNRTLKTKMFKYFTHRNTYNFVNVLQDMIYSYNHTYHRTIGRAPVDVSTDNSDEVYRRMYGVVDDMSTEPNLQVGDKVRIAKTRHAFRKGYLPNWTEEIFTVSETIKTDPPTYKIVDYDGESVEGTFYDKELQRVVKTDDASYVIEKILRVRKRAGRKEFFVKWRGYPNKFNSWIDETQVTPNI